MSLLRGLADDYPLMDWLQNHIWPAEAAIVDYGFCYDGTELAIAEMLLSGTTCFSDMYFFPNATALAAEKWGIRAQINFPILEAPSAWAGSAEEYFDKGLAIADEYRHSPLIETAFGPADLMMVEATAEEEAAMQEAFIANPDLYLINDGPTLPELLPPDMWDKVQQAKYQTTNSYSNFGDAVYNSQQRVLNDKKFKKINEYAKWLKKNQQERVYSLNYNTFKKESHDKIEETKQFKDIFKFNSNLTFNSPKYELNLFAKDTVLKEKRVVWHKNLKKDIYLNEALNVLSELKMNKNYTIVKQ